MMKQLYVTVIFIFIAIGLSQAQGWRVVGTVLHSEDQTPLPGAYVELKNDSGESVREALTDVEGKFSLDSGDKGTFTLQISFLGFQDMEMEVEVTQRVTDLATISITPSSVALEQVQVTELMQRAEQKDDTTQFNAQAFKVNPDANAEDLIRKMPGVVVQNGQVQAQGESVQEVLVDGKPFFSNDPNAALKTLPAEVIDKIQVFDKQSEQSQFSGFNDGNTTKAINIITKPDSRAGKFGKLYAGYGYDLSENGEFGINSDSDPRYQAGGNVNFFNGDQRISLIAQSNNVNIQNFAVEDLVGALGSSGRGSRGGRGGRPGGFGGGDVGNFLVDQQNGIAATTALGVNYSDQWGKKIKASGSYFFNHTELDTRQTLFQEFFVNDNSDFRQVYEEYSFTSSKNTNHKFNFRLDYEIDERNTIRFSPRLSVQENSGTESTIGRNQSGPVLLNESDYQFSSDLSGINLSGSLYYRHAFEKRGRTFSVRLSRDYAKNTGERNLRSESRLYSGTGATDTLDQFSEIATTTPEMGVSLSFSEPLSEKSQLSFDLSTDIRKTDTDMETFDFSESTGDYTAQNNILSNIFQSDYTTQRASIGFRTRGEKGMLFSRVSAQRAVLQNEQIFPYTADVKQTFFNVLPFAMYRYEWSKETNIRLFYRTSTSPPDITQLQEVYNNSNPLQLSIGNPDLKQNYQHNLFMRYSNTNLEKSTVFFALLGGTYTDNYVANALWIAPNDTLLADGVLLPRGGQLNSPVNLSGNYSMRSYITYGIPLVPLKTNMNVEVNANYNRLPGQINGIINYANNTTVGGGLTFSSNISEKVDFTLSSRSSFTKVLNSVNERANNSYFNQASEIAVNLIFGKNIVFRTNVAHQYYDGLSAGVDQNFLLWNASLGKKFLKDDRGELSLFVYDILRQNVSVSRSISDTYVQDTQTEVLQQYFLVKFMYRISHFGKESSRADESPMPYMDSWRGRRN